MWSQPGRTSQQLHPNPSLLLLDDTKQIPSRKEAHYNVEVLCVLKGMLYWCQPWAIPPSHNISLLQNWHNLMETCINCYMKMLSITYMCELCCGFLCWNLSCLHISYNYTLISVIHSNISHWVFVVIRELQCTLYTVIEIYKDFENCLAWLK